MNHQPRDLSNKFISVICPDLALTLKVKVSGIGADLLAMTNSFNKKSYDWKTIRRSSKS